MPDTETNYTLEWGDGARVASSSYDRDVTVSAYALPNYDTTYTSPGDRSAARERSHSGTTNRHPYP